MKKHALLDHFEKLAQLMKLAGENDFKIRAFEKATQSLASTKDELSAVVDGTVKIAGIGEGIRGAIKEFLETATTKAYQDLSQKFPESVFEIADLPGLGPKKVSTLVLDLGIQTLAELEYACKENRLLSIPGFGEKIQAKVLLEIQKKKLNFGKLRIDEAVLFFEGLQAEPAFQKNKLHAVGELGRHCEIVNALEVFIEGNQDLSKLKFALTLEETEKRISWQDKKLLFSGVSFKSQEGHKIIFWVLAAKSEKVDTRECIRALSFPEILLKDAQQFESWPLGAIETENAKRKLKPALLFKSSESKVRGFFHCHTTESDGRATLEEMVCAAEKLGYEYIGISDHSQSAFYAQGLKPERILKQKDEIKKLQKKLKIKIFHGIESDILASGELDYPKDVLEEFDFIVGSIHSRFKMDKDQMTARLCKALSNPFTTFWGHPTGKLVLGREAYALDWEACLKAAADHEVIVELNSSPQRLDIDWRMGTLLEKYKTPICINPDAHSLEGLEDLKFGEWMAEKAALPKSLVLNLKSADEMEDFLWQRKKRALSH